MNQKERRLLMLQYLINEQPSFANTVIPRDEGEQRILLRTLVNLRLPGSMDPIYEAIQDDYLQDLIAEKGITDFADLTPLQGDLYLRRGEIICLRCDAIVNGANSGMTGCYHPGHDCIDNCIHTYSGIQLRLYCSQMMEQEGIWDEPLGRARVTPAFNLPCNMIIHTVGPTIHGQVMEYQKKQLADCYRACLEAADEHHAANIAFCCLSTGNPFNFPNALAAAIAVETVKDYKTKTGSTIQVLFNVTDDEDEQLYRKLLQA